MNFNSAVKEYQNNPTKQNLKKVCENLRKQLTKKEKLNMLSGNFFYLKSAYNGLRSGGQVYNYTPINAGGVKRLGVPAVKFSDGPRGVVMGHSTCFPVSMLRGATFDDDLEYEVGHAIAEECIAGGANYFAGICINLLRNPCWGRAQESYGEDPFLLGKMGSALTRAVQDMGVMACPKHFACNSIENLRFKINVTASERTMQEVYLPHFKKCIDAGAVSVMGAYNKFRGDQCCESKYLLKDVLRDQWGFQGFTSSDFLWGVHDAKKALAAGMDIEMPVTRNYIKISHYLKTGDIKMSDVDESVENILSALIKVTPKIKTLPKSVICSKEHTQLAKKVAEEGTVLLKNDGTLPIIKKCRIAIVGRYANKINVGDHGSSNVHSPYTITPYEGLKRLFGENNIVLSDGKNLDKDLPLIKSCDIVIVCVGSDYKQEGEYLINLSMSDNATKNNSGGDRYSLRIPSEEVELIHKISCVCPKTVVNIIGGSAYIIEEWKNEVCAIIESFYNGMEGGNALANILIGNVNPSGQLPFTMAKDEKDYPEFAYPGDKKTEIEYGYYHGYTLLDKENKKAAFPFGFGLSYTKFNFSDLSIEYQDDKLVVRVNVENIGNYDGKTVVQVYVGAVNTQNNPVKLLKGFKKVFVRKGEKISVDVILDNDDLRFYDEKLKQWHLENTYNIFVGEDSEKANLLTQQITFKNNNFSK